MENAISYFLIFKLKPMKSNVFKFSLIFLVFFLGVFSHVARGHEEQENNEGIQVYKIFDPSRIFEHMHNKVVHFPIACGMVSALFEIISFRFSYFSTPANILLGISSLSAIGAFLSGKSIEEEYEREVKDNSILHSALELHETFGFVTMIVYSLALVLKFIPKMQRVASVIVILMVPIIGITGYLGGLLAH
ncbi:Uncharacterized membrane protein [Candidatus Kryptobacter tengchongensis]|nr:Uncharacterized membrane protein [Candidatus Kryptobacter tengchongensis]